MKFKCESCHKAMCNMVPQPDSSVVIQVPNDRGGSPLVIKAVKATLVCPHCGHEGSPLPQLIEKPENSHAAISSNDRLILAAA